MTTSFVASRPHVSRSSQTRGLWRHRRQSKAKNNRQPKSLGMAIENIARPLRPCYQFVPAIWRRIRRNNKEAFFSAIVLRGVALQLQKRRCNLENSADWCLWTLCTNAVAGIVCQRCNMQISIWCSQMKTKIGRDGEGSIRFFAWRALQSLFVNFSGPKPSQAIALHNQHVIFLRLSLSLIKSRLKEVSHRLSLLHMCSHAMTSGNSFHRGKFYARRNVFSNKNKSSCLGVLHFLPVFAECDWQQPEKSWWNLKRFGEISCCGLRAGEST